VRLNGEPAGTAWTAPYRLDITRLVRPGVNCLSVAVTSTWFNRLTNDAGLDEKARKTWKISGESFCLSRFNLLASDRDDS
jgi:(4-O-methyl)-D-glucuronate---lignin esterase